MDYPFDMHKFGQVCSHAWPMLNYLKAKIT